MEKQIRWRSGRQEESGSSRGMEWGGNEEMVSYMQAQGGGMSGGGDGGEGG